MSADPGDWARPIGPPEGATLPLRVVATEPGVDLARWAGDQADRVRSWLDLHGAVLLRGFGVDLDGFPAVVQAFVGAPSPYVQRSSPRTEIGNRIYTATDHPADQTILMHSENSYQRDFPGRLVFCCLRPPATGGATPVADTRRVLARIAPDLVARFAEHGVRYVRNYGTGLGMEERGIARAEMVDGVLQLVADGGATSLFTRHLREVDASAVELRDGKVSYE